MPDSLRWTALGTQHVSSTRQLSARDRFAERYAQAVRHRNHLWIATVAFHVTPPLGDGTLLDADAMAFDPAVGCYVCEQPYDERLASRRCTGEP